MKIYSSAILYGLLTNILVAILAALVIGLFLGTNINESNVSIAALIFGIVGGVLGGLVTSFKAPTSKFFNVLLLVIIEILIAFVLNLFITYPVWLNVVSILLIIPTNFLGAYFQFLIWNRP